MPDPAQGGTRAPSTADVRSMLSDICTNSEAEVSFDNLTFTINGSDDAVKAAMTVVNQIPFVTRSQYQMRVKIELANEHKEFVSGKKNGKINKIMGQSKLSLAYRQRQELISKQAMSKSSSTASTSTISISMSVETNTSPPRMASIWSSRRCLLPSHSMCRISTTSASLVSVDSTSSAL